MSIDFAIQGPARRHHQVERQIRAMIKRGELVSGQKMPSTQEMARQLNVSCTTIQKALTRLVEEGLLERNQRRGTFVTEQPTSTSSIGFYYLSERQPMILDLVESMHPVLHKRMLDIKLIPFGREFFDETDVLLDARSRELQGILITPLGTQSCLDELKKLERAGLPYVRVANDYWDDQLEAPLVALDYAAVVDAFQRLVDAGHRAIGFLGSEAGNPWEALYLERIRRHPGYRDSWRLPLPQGPVIGKPWELGPQIARGYLHENPELTAVITWHPLHTKHVVEQAAQLGRPVPEKLSVVGIEDWSQFGVEMAASAYHLPFAKVGERSAEILLGLIDRETQPRTTRIPMRLIDRGTIAPAPTAPVRPA